jgi:hypothetical protein
MAVEGDRMVPKIHTTPLISLAVLCGAALACGCGKRDIVTGSAVEFLRIANVTQVPKATTAQVRLKKILEGQTIPTSATNLSLCCDCGIDCHGVLVMTITDKKELEALVVKLTDKSLYELPNHVAFRRVIEAAFMNRSGTRFPFKFHESDAAVETINGRFHRSSRLLILIDVDKQRVYISGPC